MLAQYGGPRLGARSGTAAWQTTFTTTFPAWYSGRWPHIHFQIYPSLEAATDAGNKVATSQLALPEETCSEVQRGVRDGGL